MTTKAKSSVIDFSGFLATISTWTAKQIFSAAIKLQTVLEKATSSATAATGTITLDALTQGINNFTSNASGNWTVNIRGDVSNTLNSILAVDESITVTHIVPQGGTAYYNNVVQVDGTTTGVTTKWLNGAPTSGDASATNVYSYTIIKTASATFTVLASKAKYN